MRDQAKVSIYCRVDPLFLWAWVALSSSLLEYSKQIWHKAQHSFISMYLVPCITSISIFFVPNGLQCISSCHQFTSMPTSMFPFYSLLLHQTFDPPISSTCICLSFHIQYRNSASIHSDGSYKQTMGQSVSFFLSSVSFFIFRNTKIAIPFGPF